MALQGGSLLSSVKQLLLVFRSFTGRVNLVEMLRGAVSCMDVCDLFGRDEATGYS